MSVVKQHGFVRVGKAAVRYDNSKPRMSTAGSTRLHIKAAKRYAFLPHEIKVQKCMDSGLYLFKNEKTREEDMLIGDVVSLEMVRENPSLCYALLDQAHVLERQASILRLMAAAFGVNDNVFYAVAADEK